MDAERISFSNSRGDTLTGVLHVQEAYELHGCLTNAKQLSILKDGDHRLSDPIIMQRAMHEALDWLTEHIW